jgi:hypothetical protein
MWEILSHLSTLISVFTCWTINYAYALYLQNDAYSNCKQHNFPSWRLKPEEVLFLCHYKIKIEYGLSSMRMINFYDKIGCALNFNLCSHNISFNNFCHWCNLYIIAKLKEFSSILHDFLYCEHKKMLLLSWKLLHSLLRHLQMNFCYVVAFCKWQLCKFYMSPPLCWYIICMLSCWCSYNLTLQIMFFSLND